MWVKGKHVSTGHISHPKWIDKTEPESYVTQPPTLQGVPFEGTLAGQPKTHSLSALAKPRPNLVFPKQS